MNKNRSTTALLVVAGGLMMVSFSARAEFGVGLSLGNTGLGVEARQQLSPSFDLRFGITGLAYNFDFTYDHVDYDVEQSLVIPEIKLDWRPMQGKFRMTLAAAYYNDIQKLELIPAPGSPYTIGNGSYLGSEIGTLNGKLKWHNGAPYLGLGWDFLARDKPLGFTLDVGAYYRNEPDVLLTATGTAPGLAADVLREQQQIKSDALTFVPTIRFGLLFRFR